MIVKNEVAVIERCLKSVLPIINHWIIADTGSSDGTQEVIRNFLKDIPGTLHEAQWRDFAHNRSEVLFLAQQCADYSLIIDADDVLEFSADSLIRSLEADSYDFMINDGSIRYSRPHLVSSRKFWRWEGVLHEFLSCDDAKTKEMLPGVCIRRGHDGARRRDPLTYLRDARILEDVLETSISDFLRSRYTFYLAQSYWDCGDKENALRYYLIRAELGFWDQERFISLYRAAQLQEILHYPKDQVLATYIRATAMCPLRAEALHGASRYCRLKGLFREGYEFALGAVSIVSPSGGLFVEEWIYDYGILDELSVNAYWIHRFDESLHACLSILEGDKIPSAQRGRICANARFALTRICPAPSASNRKVAINEKTKSIKDQYVA